MKPAGVRRDAVLVLLSGGVDSSTVCLYLREREWRVLPHFVAYGQRAAASEWKAARAVARRLGLEPPTRSDIRTFGRTLDFGLIRGTAPGNRASFSRRFRESFFPHRNLLLATCAAMQAASKGVSAIALGIVGKGEPAYPDTTPAFLRSLQRMLAMSAAVRVLAPFANKTKDDVARYGWDRGFDYGLTYSCHRQSGVHCGQCAGCIERDRTLAEYPSRTSTRYARPVEWVS